MAERIAFDTPAGRLVLTWHPHDPDVPWVPARWTAELDGEPVAGDRVTGLLEAMIREAESRHARALPGAA